MEFKEMIKRDTLSSNGILLAQLKNYQLHYQ
jgi:hypothetical protein